ncbi:hypothetical protein INT45_012121 [Circinella minor]|uniref:F-box domain-containing protein n=1 Tax=Circinella minor TaxID=1195481 RepID=A0A8H7SA87_9FUNG|nr:hypothetical protein INT45_012121 [Circinella minor]
MESTKVRAGTRKYEEELQDAWDMIAFDPEDPTGYLTAGYCYKDQRKQEKAIHVFNMGLKQVSVTHYNYDALRQRKQEAKSRKTKRVDILSQLPLEITHHIIDNFDQESITLYSRICSSWRNIILKHSKYWERMTIAGWEYGHSTLLPFMLLSSVSQYVQEIVVFIINSARVATLFKVFQTANFSKIRLLKIVPQRCLSIRLLSIPTSYAELLSALNPISKTLTTLDLALETKSTNLPKLSDILNISGKLTTLRYIVKSDNPVFIPTTVTAQQKTLLKELVLFSENKRRQNE